MRNLFLRPGRTCRLPDIDMIDYLGSLKIQSPLEYTQKEFRPYELEVLNSFRTNRITCILAARQMRKTTLMMMYAHWMMASKPNFKILWVGTTLETSKIGLNRLVSLNKDNRTNFIKKHNRDYIEYTSDSRLDIISGNTFRNVRDCNYDMILVDESCYIEKLDKMFKFFHGRIPKTTKIICCSTLAYNMSSFKRALNVLFDISMSINFMRLPYHLLQRDPNWREGLITAYGPDGEDRFNADYEVDMTDF